MIIAKEKLRRLYKEIENINFLENKYHEKVLESEVTYKNLIKDNDLNESLIIALKSISISSLNSYKKIIKKSLSDIETLRSKAIKYYNSELNKLENI